MKAATHCRDFDRLASAYVDHETSPEESQLVEQHAQECAACGARLRRMQRLAPRLDVEVQALLNRAELAAQHSNTRVRIPPVTMLENASSSALLSRFSTVGVLLVFVVLTGLVLLRSAPNSQSTQTASQPESPPTTGPVVAVHVEGLVDPPTAQYIRRGLDTAEQEHATLLLALAPSGALNPSMSDIESALAAATVPTYAYVQPTPDSTSIALAAATGGTLTSLPSGATVTWVQMNVREAIWHRILDPTVAYLFFVLGLYALFVEIAHPGGLLAGVTGLVSMGTAAVAFSTLPTNWLAVCGLVAGVGLMAVELKSARHGMLMLCGVVSLAAASLSLYGAALSGVTVAPAVLLVVVASGVILALLIAGVARRIQRLPPLPGLEQLVGARGVAKTTLNPGGVVHVRGQTWSAHARGGPVPEGEPVRVLARRGLILDVESATLRAAATQKGAQS